MLSSGYGTYFRKAFSLLHGGSGQNEPGMETARRRGEPLQEYLARSRAETLDSVRVQLAGVEPPQHLAKAHHLLLQLIEAACETDAALSAQVEAYRCGQFDESIARSERLESLVREGARLNRELVLALDSVETENPGTLADVGLAGLLPDS